MSVQQTDKTTIAAGTHCFLEKLNILKYLQDNAVIFPINANYSATDVVHYATAPATGDAP